MNGSFRHRVAESIAGVRLLGFACLAILAIVAGCSGSKGQTTSVSVPPPPVTVCHPEKKDLVRKVSLPGSALAWEQVMVHSKVAGYIKSIHVDRGDAVRAGEVIAEIEIPELEDEVRQQRAAVEEAESAADMARATEQRLKNVQSAHPEAVTVEEVEVAGSTRLGAESRLRVSRALLEKSLSMEKYARIRAPLNAIVGQRFMDAGALVPAATSSQAYPMVSLYAIDRMRIVVDLAEPDAKQVSVGSLATLTFDALPGRTFAGRVGRFSGALDPATRTLRAEIDVQNPRHEILPGMFGQVRLDLETHRGAITIPAGALVIEKQKRSVFEVENGKARKIAVRTGADDGISVEILEGLEGDERVVLAGKESLADGLAVHLAGGVP